MGTTIRDDSMDEMIVTGTQGDRYTVAELKATFDAIADPDDWRGPIAAWIYPNDFRRAADAVEFYTATTLRVMGGPQPLTGCILVEADGYRRGPAGDH
ncbi:MAG: hypothetical protein OCU12_07240 [Methanophagales archaeon]|nr:hypothetical protein [Methanophagales archaeon]